MALTPRGFDDVALDKMVTICTAYVTAQKALYLAANPSATTAQIKAAVGFTAERDRLTPPHEDDLIAESLVVFGMDTDIGDASSDKTHKKSKATFFADCFVARGESADGFKVAGDKGATARLLYLKAQVEAALFGLANYHLGFSVGTIARKPFGRWQTTTGTDETGERWVVSGRWTFEADYEWAPESPQGVALDEITVDAGIWSALYDYT